MAKQKLSLFDSVNENSQGNEEKTIFQKEKERKSTRNHKSRTGKPRSTGCQKSNRIS